MTPTFRAIARTPAVRTLVQTIRSARLLRPRGRVLAGQARRSGTLGAYRLRGTDCLVHVRHRTRDLDMLAEVFYRDCYEPAADVPLDGPIRIVDAGGNIGMFGLFAIDRWDVISVHSYEPDAANLGVLRANAEPHEVWTVAGTAVSNFAGTMRFATGMFSESRAADDDEPAVTVPVVDLFALPPMDLLKLDIEGGEWAILTDPRLSQLSARAVVMEWHARNAPNGDPRGLASELLAAAGFTRQQHGDVSESNGVLWAWRSGSSSTTALDQPRG